MVTKKTKTKGVTTKKKVRATATQEKPVTVPVTKSITPIRPFSFMQVSTEECINLTNVRSINVWRDPQSEREYVIRFFFEYLDYRDMKFKTKEDRDKVLRELGVPVTLKSVAEKILERGGERKNVTRKTPTSLYYDINNDDHAPTMTPRGF